jgi:hypothetical protein
MAHWIGVDEMNGNPQPDATARVVLDHMYDAVWRLIQTRNQMTGEAPWPDDIRAISETIMAATIGYLTTAADQLDGLASTIFRATLVAIAESEGAFDGESPSGASD